MRGNPAKTTLILSFPGGSRNPSMLQYALFSVPLSKFLGFFFAEHERAVAALADKMNFGWSVLVSTPRFNLCQVVQVERSISHLDEVPVTLLCSFRR